MDIEKLADEFFEWDGPRTPVVSFVSAKLFAQHVTELALKEATKEANRNVHIAIRYPHCPQLQARETQVSIVHALRQLSKDPTNG